MTNPNDGAELHVQLPPWAVPGEYDKRPAVAIDPVHPIWSGDAAWAEIGRFATATTQGAPVIVVDTYPGTDHARLANEIAASLPEYEVLNIEKVCARPSAEVEELLADQLTEDRVFGVMSHLRVERFYRDGALDLVAQQVEATGNPTVLVGLGAVLVPVDHCCRVLADMARWEIQLRQRAGAPNWLAENGTDDNLRKFKRGYFIDWRVADRHKREHLSTFDYILDTNRRDASRAITAAAFHEGLDCASSQPFRVVPFFDPGVWGGNWMEALCELEPQGSNYAWCFDCVPEENSLLLRAGDEEFEMPAMNVVLARPDELLGRKVHTRFGAEFPIRFDFLDTMGGQNLSLQVHPLTDYIYQRFGMPYTQDESYYILDAADDAEVYLGLKDSVDPSSFERELRAAAEGDHPFPAAEHVNTFAARRHDHFLIPAGTVHCSGANSMVLEVSATPYIFTFKMWDWGRLGLDGRPRPIHLDHALSNIQWQRTTRWALETAVGQVEHVASGSGWREERTGSHELGFLETRRHWFTERVPHDTHGTVNVLNLVQGRRALVESPTGAFAPFEIHYAETFIVPAEVGAYTIRPVDGDGAELATLKAFVRASESFDAVPEPKASR